jgi:hypothetical protein
MPAYPRYGGRDIGDRASTIAEKAGRLPIAAIAENVINAYGFADRER